MQERLQGILNRIKEWWSKFTTKQKALLISIVTVVVMAIVVLAFIMTRPKMVTLINCESTKEAGTVKDLLEGESIAYEVSKDGLTFSVNEKDEATAPFFWDLTIFRQRVTRSITYLMAAFLLQKQIRRRNISYT